MAARAHTLCYASTPTARYFHLSLPICFPADISHHTSRHHEAFIVSRVVPLLQPLLSDRAQSNNGIRMSATVSAVERGNRTNVGIRTLAYVRRNA